MALINGEKVYSASEEGNITSAKLRMDTETGKVYLMSYKSQYATVEYSYHVNGTIKSETAKMMGTIPVDKTEYDTKGNQLKDGSEREFYDDGVIKREILLDENRDETHFYEYDTEGRLVKYSVKSDGAVIDKFEEIYEYNADGICVLIKHSKRPGTRIEYSTERKIIGYEHEIKTTYSFGSSPSGHYRYKQVEEIFNGEVIKEISREESLWVEE